MPKYFGTDGVRGVAGPELSAELAFKIGRAAGLAFKPERVLIGKDTRTSGPALEAACAAGLAEAGCDVVAAGVIPSPAISHLVRLEGFDLGVVVSASHNPPQDNGIKLYGPDGLKLSPQGEEEVEGLLGERPDPLPLGRISQWAAARELYMDFLSSSLGDVRFSGLRLVVDCAHGATAVVAPELLEGLGATVSRLGCEPDGERINRTGVMDMRPLRAMVLAEGADLGLAFDGDGDRVLFVDPRGEVVEGDKLMAALAPHLLEWGELKRPAVVFTVLANMGAERYLLERGLRVVRVPVGDRNVSWEMRNRGIDLGGEPSGHIVFGRYAPTGDGILTGLMVIRSLIRLGTDLSELVKDVTLFPQVRVDVPAEKDRHGVLETPPLREAIRRAEERLGGKGRLIVRPSGTQPLIRLLAEGEDEDLIREVVEELAGKIKEALDTAGPRS